MLRNATALLVLGLLGQLHASQAAGATISLEGTMHHITAGGYEATISTVDGSFTSLKVAGTEFMAVDCAHGGYFYQAGVPQLTTFETPAANVVVGTGDKASARFEAGENALTLTLSNLTDQSMEYVMVFGPNVNVMRDEHGKLRKAPLERTAEAATWYSGATKIHVQGSSRVWGPWEGPHQVWTVGIPAHETRVVTIEAGTADAAETAEVAAEAARVVLPPSDPDGPMWDLTKLGSAPAYTFPEGFSPEDVKDVFYQNRGDENIRAIYFDGPPYQDQPTTVFAWLGLPKMVPGDKVPGIVLVHGGGGSAFAEWVAMWTRRGYAAIAIDTCGCVPLGTYGGWHRNEHGGPPGWGGFEQIDEPREDQWGYHAVAAAILANSLLRSLPEVDPDRVGLTGISWGGYLTSMIAGADDRFRFAVPVYGCGFTLDMAFAGSVTALGPERGDRWMRWWDPSAYLPHASMPMLWVNGSNDFAYTPNAWQKSYRLPTGPRTLCMRLRMPHGHGGAGEDPEEIHALADYYCKGGDPLPTITGQGRTGNEVWVTYDPATPVVSAELNITKATGNWPDREWVALPARLAAPGRIEATLPEGVTVYYLNLTGEGNLLVSTEHEELAP